MTPEVHWSKVICRQPGNYLAWPTIARRDDGELLKVYYQIDPPDNKPSIQATRWSLIQD